MNIIEIKLGFLEYLDELSDKSNIEYDTSNAETSIFKYSSEFRDYISSTVADISAYNMSISQIIVALTSGDENANNNETETENNAETESEALPSSQEMELISGMIDDLLKDTTFKNVVDIDGNAEVSDDELENFLNYIKDLDEDSEFVSLNDVLTAIDEIQNGTFDVSSLQIDDQSLYGQTYETPEEVAAVAASSGASGTSYYPPKTAEKSLSKMSNAELKEELSSANNTLSEQQTNLASIIDGSHPTLAALKENANIAYEDYLQGIAAFDKDLSDELKTAQTDIDAKKTEISDKDKSIMSQNQVVSEANINLDNAKSTQTCLETALQTLQSTDTSEYDSEKMSEYQQKLTSAQQQLDAAKEAVKKAEDAKKEAEGKLEDLKNEKKGLNDELSVLNNNKTALEAKIDFKEHPELLELKNVYIEADKEFNNKQSEMKAEAQTQVDNAQEYVNKVNVAINNNKNMDTTRDLRMNTLGEEIIEFAEQFKGKTAAEMSKIMKSYGYQFDSGAWCADFTSFCFGVIIGESSLPDWYKDINRAYCPSIMNNGNGHQINISDAQPGDLVMLGVGGTGREHAAIFAGWADESHNAYYTIERCHINGGDGVGTLKRTVSSGDIGAIFRMTEG